MLVSFFAAIFVLTIMFINVWAFFSGVEDQVHNAANIALETMLSGLNSFVRLYYEQSERDLFDADGQRVIDSTVDQAQYLHEEIENIADRFFISYAIGFALSVFIFVFSWIKLIFSFRSEVLAARRGVWSFEPAKVRMADAANFVGISISNGLMSFIYLGFIFTALTFILVWDLTVSRQ